MPTITRRKLLRAAGIAIALPYFASLPRLHAADPATPAPHPARLVCVYFGLGVCNESWYPATTGPGWVPSPSLEPLAAHRQRLSVLSGLSHAALSEGRGHEGASTWLTARAMPDRGISFDQLLAEQYRNDTRFASLQLSHHGGVGTTMRSQTLSFNRAGVPMPSLGEPQQVFDRLFVVDTPEARKLSADRLIDDRSVLDTVLDQAKAVDGALGVDDRRRFDQYLTSIRTIEEQLTSERSWLERPKSNVHIDAKELSLAATVKTNRGQWLSAMYELIALALQTDTTRVVSFLTCSEGFTSTGWPEYDIPLTHTLQHHNGNEKLLAQLAQVDRRQSELFAAFLTRLQGIHDGSGSLLDRSVIIYGTGMNNGDGFKNGKGPHGTRKLATILAGGQALGLKHGQHLLFPDDRTPLANLWVSALDSCDVHVQRFVDGIAPLAGLI